MKTPKEAVKIGLVWVPTEIRIWCLAISEQSSPHLQVARIIASAIYTARLFLCVAAHLSYPIVCVCVWVRVCWSVCMGACCLWAYKLWYW